jgi:hypothetical protein
MPCVMAQTMIIPPGVYSTTTSMPKDFDCSCIPGPARMLLEPQRCHNRRAPAPRSRTQLAVRSTHTLQEYPPM